MGFEKRKNLRAKHLYKIDLSSKKTIPYAQKNKEGIFGTFTDLFSVLETQARKALHEHMIGTTNKLPPFILEAIAQYPELMEIAAQVLK